MLRHSTNSTHCSHPVIEKTAIRIRLGCPMGATPRPYCGISNHHHSRGVQCHTMSLNLLRLSVVAGHLSTKHILYLARSGLTQPGLVMLHIRTASHQANPLHLISRSQQKPHPTPLPSPLNPAPQLQTAWALSWAFNSHMVHWASRLRSPATPLCGFLFAATLSCADAALVLSLPVARWTPLM